MSPLEGVADDARRFPVEAGNDNAAEAREQLLEARVVANEV